jgi:hypothetical protein
MNQSIRINQPHEGGPTERLVPPAARFPFTQAERFPYTGAAVEWIPLRPP